MVLLGIFFVGAGAWIAQSNDLLHRLLLDMNGERGVATAEPFGPDKYRLRLSLDSAIYARIYDGALSGGSADTTTEFVVPVSFDSTDPGRFLPSGLSYKPAIFSLLLFGIGMVFVLMARRATRMAERLQEFAHARFDDAPRQKDQRHKHKHKHRHGHGHRHRSSVHRHASH